MDEYFLDINFLQGKSRDEILKYGRRLRNLIYNEIGLVCSIGISYSKTYSKLASDINKPNGLTPVLNRNEAKQTLWPLPLDEVWGIGRKRYKKLKEKGYTTIADGIDGGYPVFQKLFGAYFGKILYEMINGKDRAKVLTEAPSVKENLNYMHTFSSQSTAVDKIRGELRKGIGRICYRMRGYGIRARNYFCYLRIQASTHKGVSFRFNTDGYTNLDSYIHYECMKKARPQIKKILQNGDALRGVGIGTVKIDKTNQQELFFQENRKTRRFYLVKDAVNNRFGKGKAVTAAAMNSTPGKTHFLARNFLQN